MSRFKWTKEKVKNAAKRHTTPASFMHNAKGAYNAALANGWLEEVTKQMKPNRKKWDKENIISLAKCFSTFKEFREKEASAYLIAKNNGWFEEATAHMTKVNISWTDEMIINEARKYKTRREFELKSPSACQIARGRKLMDIACSHMDRVGNYLKRLVYAYEFPDNVAYVGLTFNKSQRHSEHMSKPKSVVYRHIKKSGLSPEYKIISNEYIDAEDARSLEEHTINQYIKQGWKILNSVKGGGLGGTLMPNDIKWTYELCKDVAANFKRRIDFYRGNVSCYMFASKRGWLNEICSHMVSISLTKEECRMEAKKYKSISDFLKLSPKAYYRAWSKKWIDEICVHMKRYIQWNEELVTLEAKKYTSRGAFQKNSHSAYGFAKNHNLLDVVCKHMKPLLTYWSLQKVFEEVKSSKTMKEFRTKSPKAYEAASHNGWLDEVWKIILNSNPKHRKRPIRNK